VKSWTLRDLSFMGENLVAPLCLDRAKFSSRNTTGRYV